MELILVSLCNAFPHELVLGVYDFDADEFAWVDMPTGENPIHGATGICRTEDAIFVLLQQSNPGNGLVMFDNNLKFQQHYILPTIYDAHSIIARNGNLLAADSARNRVVKLTINKESGSVTEEEIWRYCDSESDEVHVNSLIDAKGHLYVSMFGHKVDNSWLDCYDGKIIDATSDTTIYSGLFHPHTLKYFDGAVYYLESRRGLVHVITREGKHETFCKLDGYLRGMDVCHNFLYIGASASRRKSRSLGTFNTPANIHSSESILYRINLSTGDISKRIMTNYGLEIYDIQAIALPKDNSVFAGRDNAVTRRIRCYEDCYMDLLSRHDLLAEQIEERDGQLRKNLSESQELVSELEGRLMSIYGSTSWRVTAPLRRIKNGVLFLGKAAKTLIRR